MNIQLRNLLFTLVLLFNYHIVASAAEQSIEIGFYSEQLQIGYDTDIILPGLLLVEDISLMDYFKEMENTPYQSILDNLLDHKNKYQLNDWLYYELLKTTVDQIFKRQGPIKKGVNLWFLLTKSGYDTRLSYLDNDIFIYVWSEEDIFETPMIQDKQRKFINLSSINVASKRPPQLKLLLFRPGSEGVPFSFKMDELPQLSAQIKSKEVSFRIEKETHKISFDMDETLFEIMKNYPAIAEQEYFNIPMSTVTYNSLIPKLQQLLEDKSNLEALEMLVAFTRTGFAYKDDNEIFGRSKPMIAEELFHYPYSDCEDRSALFYYLVKEILDLPMLILAYPDHLTIAVASEEINGQAFIFNDLKYFICDPTGPAGSKMIGKPPNGYEDIAFTIIGAYNN